MCDEKEQAIVLDNGSGMSKAGFAGYNAPAYTFPSVVGFWRYPGLQNMYPALEQKYSFVGYEAQSRSKILELVYPIEHGIVTNWYAMEKLWKYTFGILEIKQDSSKPVLLTEPHFNKTNREKMTEVITIREERFKCVEILFNPVVAREMELNIPIQQIQGVQEILHDAIMRCPEEIRKELYANILLSGGTTLVPGFADRLKKDLSALVPSTMEINISQGKEEEDSFTCNPWLGGSILAILASQKMWISKHEYDEFGASIVHRKFF